VVGESSEVLPAVGDTRVNSSTDVCWYAMYTRSRHEKKVELQLQEKGIESYLPKQRVLRRWSDRRKWVEEPLFRCYIFIHVNAKDRLRALQTYGSVRIVSFNGRPAVVSDIEIERIKRILNEIETVQSCPPVSEGDIVEIVRGPLKGIRGRLEELRDNMRIVVEVESIHQALRFNIDGLDVRVVKKFNKDK